MESSILERLRVLNPWLTRPGAWGEECVRRLPAPMVPRRIDRRRLDRTDKAKVIVGPRQVGKSTFIWSELAERGAGSVLYLDCQEERVRAWLRSAAAAVADLEVVLPGVRTLFLEEVQHLPEAGLVLKGLIDTRRGLDVWATGSSAFHLGARTRESLAGRAVRRRVLPLSLEELVAWRAPASRAADLLVRREVLGRMLVHGGYPEPWFDPAPQLALQELLEAVVVRDASDRFKVDHVHAFRRMLELAAGQVGQMVNLSEWASILGVSGPTVSSWLGLLEEAWVLRRLPPFADGRRREITGARRVAFYDVGLRNALLRAFEPQWERRSDAGALLEAWVFGELCKVLDPFTESLHYWRTKGGAEVDFVVQGGGEVLPVEVKARDPRRVSRSLRSFIDAYRPERAVIACGRIAEGWTVEVGTTVVEALGAMEIGRRLRGGR